LQQFDKAIHYFQALSYQKNLFSKPGKFYEALVLMKQELIHKKEVEPLRKEVIDNNLEGSQEERKLIES